MPQVPILTTTGQKSGTTQLPDQLFAAKINPQLMAQAVRVYLANQRQSPAHTKSRSQVRTSGRKIWRQKGTGRARHGARSAPIFVGGGIAHGPTGEQNYQLRMSKKMNRAALASALTSKLKDQQILVLQGLEKLPPKTKSANQILTKLKLNHQKTTFILPEITGNIILATRNLPRVSTTQAHLLNTYTVLNADTLIFLPQSIDKLKKTFLKDKNPSLIQPTTPSPTKKKPSSTKRLPTKSKSTTTKKPTTKKKPATHKKPSHKLRTIRVN
jgi:large subunit ribosomal protein L4